jgi:catechol 2,3-dioxygenase-like lactoylglutathione lyase family enzyme
MAVAYSESKESKELNDVKSPATTPKINFQRFEHINLSCRDINVTRQFYQTLFPDWFVRTEGEGWMHFGNHQFYLSLFEEPSQTERRDRPYYSIGINHVGFVVEDGEAMKTYLDAVGIDYVVEMSPETLVRLYLSDPDGNEIELVAYPLDYPFR